MEKIAFELEVNSNGAVVAAKSFKQELREAQQEAVKSAMALGATSKEAVAAAQKVARLKEEIADVKDTINALNPEAKLNAVTTAVSGIAGGFAAAEGAMALFGTQSEDVQKQLVKIQGALALSQGINQVLGMGDAMRNLGIVIKATTIYQIAYNFVMAGSTVATQLFRLALIAIPFVAIAIGVLLVVQNFDKLKNIFDKNSEAIGNFLEFLYRFMTPVGLIQTGIEKLGEKFESVQYIIDSVKKSFTAVWDSIILGLEYLNLLDTAEEDLAQAQAERLKEELDGFDKKKSAREREIALAKAQGATDNEVREMEMELLKESIYAYENYIEARKNSGEEITEDELDELDKRKKAFQIAAGDDLKADKDATDKKIKEEQDKQKKLADERKKAADDRAKKAKEEVDKIAAIEKALQDEKIKAIQDGRERELAQIDIDYDRRIQAITGNTTLEIEYRKYLEAAKRKALEDVNEKFDKAEAEKKLALLKQDFENSNAKLQAQILNEAQNSKAFFQAERDLLNSQFQEKLATEKLSDAQLLLARAQYNKSLNQIDQDQANENFRVQQQIAQSRLNIAENTLKGVTALGSLVTNNANKQAKVNRDIALIQLSIDTAKSISSTIAGASAAAAAGGPAAPYLLIGYITSGIATVLTAFVSAKKLLGGTVSQQPSISTGSNTSPNIQFTSTKTPTSIPKQAPQSIKATVVETDIAITQKRVNAIQERAVF